MTFQSAESVAVQPIDHPYEMSHPGRRPDFGQKTAGSSCRDTLATGRAFGDARHRLLLRLEQRAVFQRVSDLEDILLARSLPQKKVLIAFARQRGRRRVEAVKIARERRRLFEAEIRRMFEQ